ncbi:PEP-CTERM sorting domain-containing protein [Sphingomonas pseudosanguinis]|uniref:Npun_F0296 family exosortase-dependent surface protein n=1 Tax=Sphingomonas pseudosanguinis TaxID=413712 RepID=UPI003F855807
MRKFTTALISVAAAALAATSVQAAPGTVTSTANDYYSAQRNVPAGSTVVTFDTPQLPNGFSLQGGTIGTGSVWDPSVGNWKYVAPSGDSTNFLVTLPNASTTLTADKRFGYGSVGLNWGSIDTSNILDVLDIFGNVITSITGSNLLSNRSLLDFSTNRYVTYSLDPNSGQQIGGLRFTSPNSNGWSFEVDDIAFSNASPAAVPEPASIALFGAGLAGLVGVARRRRRQAA